MWFVSDRKNDYYSRRPKSSIEQKNWDDIKMSALEQVYFEQCQIKIWRWSDCNWTRTQNHLVLKRTLNHLAKLTKWSSCALSTYLYGAFDCMFLSCLKRVHKIKIWIWRQGITHLVPIHQFFQCFPMLISNYSTSIFK